MNTELDAFIFQVPEGILLQQKPKIANVLQVRTGIENFCFQTKLEMVSHSMLVAFEEQILVSHFGWTIFQNLETSKYWRRRFFLSDHTLFDPAGGKNFSSLIGEVESMRDWKSLNCYKQILDSKSIEQVWAILGRKDQLHDFDPPKERKTFKMINCPINKPLWFFSFEGTPRVGILCVGPRGEPQIILNEKFASHYRSPITAEIIQNISQCYNTEQVSISWASSWCDLCFS